MEKPEDISKQKVKVDLLKKGNLKGGKCIIIDDISTVSMKWLKQLAYNKLRIKPKQVYIQETSEIIETDTQLIAALEKFSVEFHQEQGTKPTFKFVFCSEKELNKTDNQENDQKEQISTNKESQENITQPKEESSIYKQKSIVKVIAKSTRIEEESIKQLHNVAKFPGCIYAFGMPDLHPGKGIPIGASIITEGIIYPELVDNDIGCGMSFIKTGLHVNKISQKKLTKLQHTLKSIDSPWTSDFKQYQEFLQTELNWAGNKLEPIDSSLLENKHLSVLGTIGGGNHFAEFQEIKEIYDMQSIQSLNIDPNEVFILIHSGSRSLGENILHNFLEEHKGQEHRGALQGSEEFNKYMKQHDMALNFARRNRFLIANRILGQISSRKQEIDQKYTIKDSDCLIDIIHNFVESDLEIREGSSKQVWIHRKGATPSNRSKYLVIPGSRGSYSYLVQVISENAKLSGFSLAHGAGRKMNRSKALTLNKSQHPNPTSLLKTEFDSLVICEKKTLVYEEAPNAYKNIEDVIQDMVEFNLIKVVARLKPLLTYKFREPKFNQ